MFFDLITSRFVNSNTNKCLIAVDDGHKEISWNVLKLEVDEWVKKATAMGAEKDTPLLIYGHKEATFVIAMIGCMIIGCPFVPVDKASPEDRMRKIAAISRTNLIFFSSENKFEKIIRPHGSFNYQRDLAYIIFTSGTTGEPKGVQIGRESVVSLVKWMANEFLLPSYPIFMNQAPFSFDLSMYEVMSTLQFGGCIVLNSRQILSDAPSFFNRLRNLKVNVWVSTPSFAYQQLLNEKFNKDFLDNLDVFIFCGEPLSVTLSKILLKRFPSATILNTYGPTEATVATTLVVVNNSLVERFNDRLPVGKAKPGSYVFIEPEKNEICIAGEHVMRGYINRPDLNQEKLTEYKGLRCFRTGDSGYIDPDGMIFCLGRMDEQIKLNGYRIEPSEIDRCLESLDLVVKAATIVLKRPDGSPSRLVSFIQFKDSIEGELNELKLKLNKILPTYMVPSEILKIKKFPVSLNHKIDKIELQKLYESNNFDL